MATTNPVTGDRMVTKTSSTYGDGWERIFGKGKEKKDEGDATANGRHDQVSSEERDSGTAE